jgi:hypothetical protein
MSMSRDKNSQDLRCHTGYCSMLYCMIPGSRIYVMSSVVLRSGRSRRLSVFRPHAQQTDDADVGYVPVRTVSKKSQIWR